MSSRAVDITLLGRTYSIACPLGQEQALHQVAAKLEKQLTGLKTRTNNLNREDIAIMAALNIGYELLEEQIKNKNYMQLMDERISLLQATLEEALVTRSSGVENTQQLVKTVSQIKELPKEKQ